MRRPQRSFRRALRTALFSVAAVAAPIAAVANICSEANVNAYLAQGDRTEVIDKQRFYQNAKEFFSVYAKPGGHYAGTDAILDYWNEHLELRDNRWLAYVLATAWHETAQRMAPVRETLASTDASAVQRLENWYVSRGRRGPVYWRPDPTTGHSYFGRGYVQLTWDYNYQRADQRFGITEPSQSFYWNPNFVLEERKSIEITYDGMIYGWYTGRCLLQYIQENRRADYVESRRIINGKDKAALIADHAQKFERIINASLTPVTADDIAAAGPSIATTPPGTRSGGGGEVGGMIPAEVMERIAALETSLANERSRTAALTTANRQLTDEFSATQTEMTASLDEMRRTREEVELARRDLDETRTRLGEILSQMEALRGDIAETRSSVTDRPVNTELSSTDKERIAQAEQALRQAATDQQRTRDQIEALERQVNTLAAQLNDQDARFAALVSELERGGGTQGGSVWDYWFGTSE